MRIAKVIPLIYMLFAAVYSCGQNGPTKPSVVLSWTQSITPGITANCIYRGSVSGQYTIPALYCSTTPIVTYTDATVARGGTYYYAMTARLNAIESGYSNEVAAAVPTIAPPTGAGAQETKLRPPVLHQDKPVLTAKVVWR